MSQKSKMAKELYALEEEIKALELKLFRSMAALMEAIISHTPPTDADVQFFRAFTSEVNYKREQLKKLTTQYENL